MRRFLIFDFDGVIGNTKEQLPQAHVNAGNFKSIEEAKAHIIAYSSTKPNHTRNHTLTEAELHEQFEFVAKLGEAVHKLGFPLFDDFVKEIESIKNGYKAIVSSGSQNFVIPAIADTEINPTHILAYEDHHSKEEKIEIVAKDWGVEVSEIYYFTDTLADVYELKNFVAKEKLIGVSWGYCTKEQLLQELEPEFILDAADEIHRVL